MPGVNLRQFQHECVQALRSGKVLAAGVGAGKSIMALYWYVTKCCTVRTSHNANGELFQIMPGSPDLVIITTAKKRDNHEWDDELYRYALHQGENSKKMGRVHVTIDSWNNITKYVDTSAVFIFDEQRAIGSGAWSKAFVRIARRNPWVMLSATPADTWSDWCPIFVADGFYRNRTEFFRRHAVYSRYTKYPRIDRWIDEDYLNRCRDRVLVTCEVPRETERVVHQLTCAYDKETVRKAMKTRWNPETEEPFLNATELCFYLRRVIDTDPTRLSYAAHVVRDHRKVIIFYTLRAELEQILKLEEVTGVPVYQYNGGRHDDLPQGNSWVYAVQFQAGSEGWNCTSCNTVLYWSLPYSYKQAEQAAGRIDRLDTSYKTLNYYIMRSFAPLDLGIIRALRNKENFNASGFLRSSARQKE